MDKLIKRTNEFCARLEETKGLIATSFIIGFVILAFDLIYITPKFEAAYHGLQYSTLSNNPFDFTTQISVRYRILPSLIGYITFLRGDLFFIVPLIFALLFISSVYWVYRKRDYTPIDSILFTGFIAFSCTLYIQLFSPGYTDVVFYFFLFLSFTFVRNVIISSCFFCLALLTHECCLFLLPSLLLYANYHNDKSLVKFLKYIIAYSLSIIPLLLYRHWVASHTAVEYDLGFYFSEKNIRFAVSKALPLFPAGAFYAFKLFWFFPVYILYKTWSNREFDFFIIIASIIICNASQLIIAFDITRMLCLGFPAILIAAEKLKTLWSPHVFTKFVLGLTAMNFFIIQYFVSCDGIVPMLPWPYTFILNLCGANI